MKDIPRDLIDVKKVPNMKKIPRIVPWTSPEEFQQVHKWLYAESPKSRELGVKRVKAWSSRGRVPHAILSTAAFVEASLRDDLGYGKITTHELRLLYSMVFVRFVNGMVDPAQQGVFASSIASIATKLHMPLWFVELRHAATHERLPSLQILRNGCKHALQWLNENFWSSQMPWKSTQIDEMRSMVLQYKELRKENMNSYETNERDPSTKVVNNIMDLISEEYIREILISVLLEPGVLVPMAKKKRVLARDLSLSQELIQIWMPMLNAFGEKWSTFGDELIFGMLEVLTRDKDDIKLDMSISQSKPAHASSSYRMTLVAWIKHVLNIYYIENTSLFAYIEVNDILELCLSKPNAYTQLILQIMAERDEDLNKSITPFLNYIEKMLHVKDIIQNVEDIPKITEEDMNAEIIKLKHDLDKANKLMKDVSSEVVILENSDNTMLSNKEFAWKMHDLNEWKPCALGCLPNGQVPCLDLPLELDGPSILNFDPIDDVNMMDTDN
ncbi:4288_t:CDS:2 [Funneliformis caledonium]|uniref:4288_t:CDS:1 n=1 Tax=Funneliformis caledonium TaxID=1117310 RepID=A0A9N8VG80_9GLOM|nr:4288_t:CDS:2 [Funneliformis caledonium]